MKASHMPKAAINRATGLTQKEKLFADLFLLHLMKVRNPAQRAAVIAYKDSEAVKRVYAYRVLHRGRVKNYLSNKFDEAGITTEFIIKSLGVIVDRGLNGKASNKDAIKGIEMTLKMRGWL